MQYTHLGRSGLRVSRLCLGTMNFGPHSSEADSFRIMDAALAQETARARHFLGLISEQSLYNLAERMIELEVLPACEAYGIGQIPYSALAGGLLGGALEKAKAGRRASDDIQQEIAKR